LGGSINDKFGGRCSRPPSGYVPGFHTKTKTPKTLMTSVRSQSVGAVFNLSVDSYVVCRLTADKEKQDLKTNKNDFQLPASVRLPSSTFTEKKGDFTRPVDIRRPQEPVVHTIGSHSGGFSAPENGSGAATRNHGSTMFGVTTSPRPQPAVEQQISKSANIIGGGRLPQVVESSRSAPARGDPEATEWKTKAKEEGEKRLRQKEEELRILQVALLFCRNNYNNINIISNVTVVTAETATITNF